MKRRKPITYKHRRTRRRIGEQAVVAHHEAGHAVVAMVVGCPVEHAMLGSGEAVDDPGEGHLAEGPSWEWLREWVGWQVEKEEAADQAVKKPRLTTAARRAELRRHTMVALGGPVAESILLGRVTSGARSDLREAHHASRLLPRGERQTFIAACRRAVRRILIARRDEWRAVAAQLQRREKTTRWRPLDGAELRRLVAPARGQERRALGL